MSRANKLLQIQVSYHPRPITETSSALKPVHFLLFCLFSFAPPNNDNPLETKYQKPHTVQVKLDV